MVLDDWQRGKLPYYSAPPVDKESEEKGVEDEFSGDMDQTKREAIEKRLEKESKLEVETQDLSELAKIEHMEDEDADEVDDEAAEDSDELEEKDEDEKLVVLDPNADQEAELAKLDKQLAMLERRNKAIDEGRMDNVQSVKERAPYLASIEEGYNAKKAVRTNNKGRNIDIQEEG